MLLVAVDAGQSGTRAVCVDKSVRSRIGNADGVRHLATPGAAIDAAARIQAAASHAMGSVRREVDTIAVGLSGFVADDSRLAELAEAVRRAIPARRFLVASDAITWHLGALHGRAGIVAAIGTGSVTLAADGVGRWVRVGGWGYLLDDAGSGFDVGRQGLNVVVHAAESHRLRREVLTDAAVARFGSVSAIPEVVYGSTTPYAAVAAFAQDVISAAEGGDAEARRIVAGAAASIADSIGLAYLELFGRDVPTDVALAGSMVKPNGHMFEMVAEILRTTMPRVTVAGPQGSALDGAILLATGRSVSAYPGGVYELFADDQVRL